MNKLLYVGGLHPNTTAGELRKLFSKFGNVINAEIPIHSALRSAMGFAFVEMETGADAAIAALDGTQFQGDSLVVNEAQQRASEAGPDLFDDILDRHAACCDRPESPEFGCIVQDLRQLAEAGHVDAARGLADILALPGPHYDPESAYKWYYIALSQQGYTIQFEDHNHKPPYYCGPIGDFRNESMPSDLVVALGFDTVRRLDTEAATWLAERKTK